MIPRTKYLDQLMAFKDKDLVKVVTGVRRCGKSTLSTAGKLDSALQVSATDLNS